MTLLENSIEVPEVSGNHAKNCNQGRNYDQADQSIVWKVLYDDFDVKF